MSKNTKKKRKFTLPGEEMVQFSANPPRWLLDAFDELKTVNRYRDGEVLPKKNISRSEMVQEAMKLYIETKTGVSPDEAQRRWGRPHPEDRSWLTNEDANWIPDANRYKGIEDYEDENKDDENYEDK